MTTTGYDSFGRVTESGIENWADLVYNYTSGNLTKVTRTAADGGSQIYNFTYDAFGNMLTAKVGQGTIASYTYGDNNGPLKQMTYGNGDTVSYTYDDLGRPATVTYDDGRVQSYAYNGERQLHSVTETGNGTTVTYLYTYDSLGRLISSEQRKGSDSVLRTHQDYNDKCGHHHMKTPERNLYIYLAISAQMFYNRRKMQEEFP